MLSASWLYDKISALWQQQCRLRLYAQVLFLLKSESGCLPVYICALLAFDYANTMHYK